MARGKQNNHEASQISPSPGLTISNPLPKVCRLCAGKEGPFWEMLDPEMGFSAKVRILLPFVVAENNNLPQNICFRCTVTVEDFYELLEKCVNTSMNCMNEVALKKVVKKAVEKIQIINGDGDYPIAEPSGTIDSMIGQADVSLETKTCVQEPSTTIAATASNLPIGTEIPTENRSVPMNSLAIAKPPPQRRKSVFVPLSKDKPEEDEPEEDEPEEDEPEEDEPEEDFHLYLSDDEVPNDPTPKWQSSIPESKKYPCVVIETLNLKNQEEPTKPPPAKRVRKSPPAKRVRKSVRIRKTFGNKY